MTRKEYVDKAKSAILNRIRFHAPIVYGEDVDLSVLRKEGIDTQKPIFKFEKKLNERLLHAFELAQQEEEFNLLLPFESLGKIKEEKVHKLKSAFVYSKFGSSKFLENVDKLNINYPSASNYNVVFKDKFVKWNGQILNVKFEPFVLKYICYQNDVLFDYQEFMLNGANMFFKLTNRAKKEKVQSIEINLPLPKGYYFFKRQDRKILIENLLTKRKMFFNYFCKNAKFSFSNVDGLENSVFCCINAKISIKLKPNEEKCLFFNFGEQEFLVKNRRSMEKLSHLSQQKTREIFNLKVKTKNPKFDNFFNRILPQQIWLNWLNDTNDFALEQKYVTYKRLFVKEAEDLSFVKFKQIGLRELGVFNGTYYKKIVVVVGEKQFLQVGKTHFYNTQRINVKTLKSRETISLCFGF